ncbi:MAG: hypothetical protein QM767_17090 [Anaeromyxobacter sp.]
MACPPRPSRSANLGSSPPSPPPAGRRPSAALALALGAVLALAGCEAHLPAPNEPSAFLERSTAFVSSDRAQAFEVDPALHLLLWNDLADLAAAGQDGVATVGSVSVLGQFRLLSGESTPLRIPTYEPRVKLQVFDRLSVARTPDEPPEVVLAALELFLGHRSNGQDACALANHERIGGSDFACVPTTDPPDTALDTRSGSFTTNYVGLGAGGQWIGPRAAGGLPSFLAALHASSEWNLGCDLGACMSNRLRRRYGAALLRWSVEGELPALGRLPLPGVGVDLGLRAGVSGVMHAAAAEHEPFGEVSLEVAVAGRPRRSGLTTALFLRRHQGSDPLNIRFEERLDVWIVGFSFEPATFRATR